MWLLFLFLTYGVGHTLIQTALLYTMKDGHGDIVTSLDEPTFFHENLNDAPAADFSYNNTHPQEK